MRLIDMIDAGSGCLPDGSCFFTMTVPTKQKKVEAGGPGSGRHPEISDTINSIVQRSGKKPYDINDGYCRDAACAIAREHPDSTIHVGITHTYVEHNGKFYDVETPQGVGHPKDLPLYEGKKSEVTADEPKKMDAPAYLKKYGRSFKEFNAGGPGSGRHPGYSVTSKPRKETEGMSKGRDFYMNGHRIAYTEHKYQQGYGYQEGNSYSGGKTKTPYLRYDTEGLQKAMPEQAKHVYSHPGFQTERGIINVRDDQVQERVDKFLDKHKTIQAGGPGSGCTGDNCGRPFGTNSSTNKKRLYHITNADNLQSIIKNGIKTEGEGSNAVHKGWDKTKNAVYAFEKAEHAKYIKWSMENSLNPNNKTFLGKRQVAIAFRPVGKVRTDKEYDDFYTDEDETVSAKIHSGSIPASNIMGYYAVKRSGDLGKYTSLSKEDDTHSTSVSKTEKPSSPMDEHRTILKQAGYKYVNGSDNFENWKNIKTDRRAQINKDGSWSITNLDYSPIKRGDSAEDLKNHSKSMQAGGPGSGRHKGTLTHDPAAKEFEVRAPEGHTFSGGERSHIFTYGTEGAEHKTMREAREHAKKWVNHNFVPDTDASSISASIFRRKKKKKKDKEIDSGGPGSGRKSENIMEGPTDEEYEEMWKKTSVGTPKEPKKNYTGEELEEFKKKHNIRGSSKELPLLNPSFNPFQQPPRIPVRERVRRFDKHGRTFLPYNRRGSM